jgi:hypothetical protein
LLSSQIFGCPDDGAHRPLPRYCLEGVRSNNDLPSRQVPGMVAS